MYDSVQTIVCTHAVHDSVQTIVCTYAVQCTDYRRQVLQMNRGFNNRDMSPEQLGVQSSHFPSTTSPAPLTYNQTGD